MPGISVDLTLPADAVAQTFAILAKRGVGKTYTALALVEELLGAGARGIIADSAGVCWGLWADATSLVRVRQRPRGRMAAIAVLSLYSTGSQDA